MTEDGIQRRLYHHKNAQNLGKNPAFSKLSLKFATQNDAGFQVSERMECMVIGVRKREMHDYMCQKEPMTLT